MTLKEFATLGGHARAAALTKEQRSKIARKAGIISGLQRASKLNAKNGKPSEIKNNKVRDKQAS